ncbi:MULTISPECIES: hypothetical protein [Apibacter]|uniref:hypothetical protein n=1 Tax=Apibacter TaxID=1778601 RepID=UPI000FEBA08C|nr:hypothetical protein [Apibacter sp. HY039]
MNIVQSVYRGNELYTQKHQSRECCKKEKDTHCKTTDTKNRLCINNSCHATGLFVTKAPVYTLFINTLKKYTLKINKLQFFQLQQVYFVAWQPPEF